MKKNIFLFILLIAVGIAGRMLPHVWNTTPMLAVILFASVYLGKQYSAWVLFLSMAISDAFLGTYQWQIMLSVYICLALACFAGGIIKNHKGVISIIATPLVLSITFYVVTNWAVWQFSPLYNHTLQGLMDSYTMAIPFFKNSLTGDLVYTALFFGVYEAYMTIKARMKKDILMKDAQTLVS